MLVSRYLYSETVTVRHFKQMFPQMEVPIATGRVQSSSITGWIDSSAVREIHKLVLPSYLWAFPTTLYIIIWLSAQMKGSMTSFSTTDQT